MKYPFAKTIRRTFESMGCAISLALACGFFIGCQTTSDYQSNDLIKASSMAASEPIILREGDVLRIAFPGAPNLNTSQQIRRDGLITLPLGGELRAAGLTTAQLESELSEHFSSQLLSKEVSVTIESSAFPVFVSGAVIRPGRVTSDRPMTVLEAIMDAGGFDYNRANLKAVKVVRYENNHARVFVLDLDRQLHGAPDEPFYLKPSDVIIVPERFLWF